MQPFTRLLGARSGVQLNPVIDSSERFVAGNSDQAFAVVGRFERGRIDKPFRVNRSNLYRMLGQPTSTSVSQLNETLVQIYEAFLAGANEAVVYRLTPAADVELNRIFIDSAATVAGDVLTTAASAPVGAIIAIKHLEAFNEGINVAVNTLNGTDITIKISDVTGLELFEFTGSTNPAAKDEFGKSTYLPNVAIALSDALEVEVLDDGAVVPNTAPFYGLGVDGKPKFVSEDLVYFTEGGTGYLNTDYDAATHALKYSDFNFGYIIGGGTQSVALLSKLIALGADINKQVIWDVPGNLSPSAAITFYDSLNIDTHYSQAYWTPLLTDDPVNGGKAYIGVSGIQVGYRCARNSRTDANGVAPKQRVIAGKEYSLPRTGVIQKYNPTDNEMDDLAVAKINPVIFVRYNSGGRYVFFDSLTGAKTVGDRKLIAVADMSSSVDDVVTAYCQEALQKPIEDAIRLIADFVKLYFEAIEAAGWIKPSAELGDRSFIATVKANAARPKDRVDVSYSLSYEGTTRAIYVQQTISR